MGLNNSNDFSRAEALVNDINRNNPNVKYIKRDNGLMEREEVVGKKIILAEDNRQVLFG